jgi:hypothetical protein
VSGTDKWFKIRRDSAESQRLRLAREAREAQTPHEVLLERDALREALRLSSGAREILAKHQLVLAEAKLSAVIGAVRSLHREYRHCVDEVWLVDCGMCLESWPCTTIGALEEALEGLSLKASTNGR